MSITNPVRQRMAARGVTLIELIIFIIIISAGVLGILSVLNFTSRGSADPMARKQAMTMAEAILEEVIAKNYCDPDLVPPACGVSRESDRSLYDDIGDYDGQVIAGNATLGSSSIAALASFSATVAVAPETAVSGVNMRQVVVTVTGANQKVSLFGYRAAGL